ncbi:MAG: conjugal transfer protein TraR [Firmicutes bacterium]|nr:conjugal transfer protein TraR [Bacillota bacterium]
MGNTRHLRARLEREKKRLLDQAERIRKHGLDESLAGSIGELSVYDNHPADIGDETYERAKDLGLLDNTQVLLAKVEEALRRLDEGIYGRCEVCGGEIDRARLEVLPYTTLCRSCKEKDESRERAPGDRRPLEEEMLEEPFGRSFLDNTDYVGFDGEAAWQAVARYGTSSGPQDVGGVDSYNDTYVNSDEQRGAVEDVEEVVIEDKEELFGWDRPSPDRLRRYS